MKHKRAVGVGGRSGCLPPTASARRGEAAFSFFEVMIAFLVVALMFGVIINGYTSAAKRMQWTGFSLAAQALSIQTIEQARSATWDPAQTGKAIEVTNLTLLGKTFTPNPTALVLWTYSGYTINILDVPWKGTNYLMATNWVTVQMFRLPPPNTNIVMQLVRVDTVWPFNAWANFKLRYYTNTVCSLLAPDNRAL